MGKIFSNIVEVSIYSGIMVCIVLIIRQVFRKASRSAISMLWILVGIRLLVFWPMESKNAVIPRLIPENIISGLLQEKLGRISADDTADIYDLRNAEHNYTEFERDTLSINRDGNKTSLSSEVHESELTYLYIQEKKDNTLLPYSVQKTDVNTNDQVDDFMTVSGFIWISGTAIILLYGLVKVLMIRNRLRTAVRLNSEKNIYLTENTESAFVFGLVRPRIYIGYVVKEGDRGYLSAHEQKHIQRKDQLIKCIWFILLAFYWFSPFVWIAFKMLCKDIELACDEGVIKSAGHDYVVQYADILYKYGLSGSKRNIGLVSFGEVSVKERIKSIMNFKKKSIIASVIAGILAITCLVAVFATGKSQAQETEKQDIGIPAVSSSAVIRETRPRSPWVASEEIKDNGTKIVHYDEYLYSDIGAIGDEKENNLEKYFNKETLELYVPADFIEINICDLERLSNYNRPVTIKVDENNPVFDSRNDCNAIIESNSGMLVYGCDNTVIPDSVTAIFPQAFYNCRFKEINIPESVSKIGGGAFWQCINLERINLPDSVEEIEPWLFFQCGKLSEIVIPQNVKSIGERAFANCGRLHDVIFNGNIENIDIERWAFYESYSLDERIKQAIIGVNEEAYPLIEVVSDDLSNVEYGRKPECLETVTKSEDCFYAVLDTLDNDGTLSVRIIEYTENPGIYNFTGATAEYKLAENCEIVVKCKHKLREKKAYYLTKSDLKYITDWYVFVQPDGKIEPGEGAFEYVYPFACRLNEQGEIISLWENYL